MSDRAQSSTLGVALLIAIVVLLAGTLFVFVQGFEPPEQAQPQAAFTLERTPDGAILAQPDYIRSDERFYLTINGERVYNWTSSDATDSRELECMAPGDTVRVISDKGDQTYVNNEYEIQQETACPVDGTARQLAVVRVGDRTVPIAEQNYRFDISIDPRGPDRLEGDRDIPASNQWHFIKRYDREVEGLEPPVYVVVFADNVGSCCGYADYTYDDQPPEIDVMDDYHVTDDGEVVIDNVGVEPTDDVWVAFQPGCEESKVVYVADSTGYTENEILVDGEKVIDDLDGVSSGDTFTAPGVTCVD